jgi:crotonobetainyl-CoA:carnitine CoA-transferase CaiB-like acyl-CoA transferase
VAQPIGTAHPNIAPYGDWFETEDGVRFVLAVGSQKQFENLLEILNLSDFAADYTSNSVRVEKRERLVRQLQSAINRQPFEELSKKLNEGNVPFGEIKSLDRVLESKMARAMTLEETIEGKATKKLSGIAFKNSF